MIKKDPKPSKQKPLRSGASQGPNPPLSAVEGLLSRSDINKEIFLLANSKPVLCTENIHRALVIYSEQALGFIRYDAFKNVIEYRRPKDTVYKPLEDSDIIRIQTLISMNFEYFQKVGKDMVYDAIIKTAYVNKYDSAHDYLSSLKWDSVPRLDQWLTSVYGTPDDLYHRSVASNWLKGLVKRIAEPGCKFDYVLVLEGPQGSKKSTSLAVLGGDWHVETTMSTDNKDFFMQFQGKAIIEFSEGETLNRTEVKRMKAIISTQVDTFRPPYGRVTKDFPRRCVFAMTTNQEEYLKDETGNRRWLPVKLALDEANVLWLSENREQLFAEAYHRVITLKETIYEFPREATLEAQQARRVSDPNSETVIDWYLSLDEKIKREGITIEEAAKQALHGGFGGTITKIEQMSVANIFKETLGLIQKQVMVRGARRRRWYPKDPLVGLPLTTEEAHAETF